MCRRSSTWPPWRSWTRRNELSPPINRAPAASDRGGAFPEDPNIMATQTTPTSRRPERSSMRGLEQQGLAPTGRVHWNLVTPELVEAAIRREEGERAEMGPFVAVTAPHTGRSPNDKFVVREPASENDVDWGKVNQPIGVEHFDLLLEDVKAYLIGLPELFIQDLYCGADP